MTASPRLMRQTIPPLAREAALPCPMRNAPHSLPLVSVLCRVCPGRQAPTRSCSGTAAAAPWAAAAGRGAAAC